MFHFQVDTAHTQQDFEQIINLQHANHRSLFDNEYKVQNGFLTVLHKLEMLEGMSQDLPQIVARDIQNNQIVGFALAMLEKHRTMIPDFEEMFQTFDGLIYKNQKLDNYYVMGQICVHKDYRGLGIFRALYQKHKDLFSSQFQYCITEISVQNQKSLAAHRSVGFQTIASHTDALDTWHIVLWDWV
jgi:ribosomal protein S18 acetylase RimI-like enzyme